MTNSLVGSRSGPKRRQKNSVLGTETIPGGLRHDQSMDASGLDELPRSYRLGLSLRALGADDQLIAECLGIDVDSVGALLEIGARKLDRPRRIDRPADPTDDERP